MINVVHAINLCEKYRPFLLSPFLDAESESEWNAIIHEATSSCVGPSPLMIFQEIKTSASMNKSERMMAFYIEYFVNRYPEFYDALIRVSEDPRTTLQNRRYPDINSETEPESSNTKDMLDVELLNYLENAPFCIHFINRLVNEGADPNVSSDESLLQLAISKPDTEDIILNLIDKGATFYPPSLYPENIIQWAERTQCNPAYITLLKEGMAKKIPVLPIPKVIHFIWNGKPIPEEYKNNIINWSKAVEKSGYEVVLWTDENTLSDEAIRQELNDHGVKLNHWQNRGQEPNERNSNIDALVSEIMVTGMQEGHSPNLSACSDVLRIAILEDQGGLYVDTDNYISNTSDTPIGDINVVVEVGARFIEAEGGAFNGCFIAALPKTKIMNDLLDYYSKLYKEGISAYPNVSAEQIKAYPQYETKSDADKQINPIINMERPDSIAWWVTKKGFFHGVDHMLGTTYAMKNSSMAVKFCSTMGAIGPGIVKHFYNHLNMFHIESSERSFPELGHDIVSGAKVYDIRGTTGSIMATDGQHGTWQDPLPVDELESGDKPGISGSRDNLDEVSIQHLPGMSIFSERNRDDRIDQVSNSTPGQEVKKP